MDKLITLLSLILLSTLTSIGQTTFCDRCNETVANGCYSCDVNNLSGSYTSDEFPPPITDAQFPAICNGVGVPNNIMYYKFLATSNEITIDLEWDLPCPSATFAQGLQMALLEGKCFIDGGGFCLGITTCVTTNSTTLYTDELTAGMYYNIALDGCNGAFCDFEIDISDHDDTFFELDPPSHFSIYSQCQETCLSGGDCFDIKECSETEEVFVCPGEVVTFIPRHQGTSSNDFEEYDDPCSQYSPFINLDFEWTFDGQDYTTNLEEHGSNNLTLTMPLVDSEQVLEICLREIGDDLCIPIIEEEICTNIIIRPIPDEIYNYNICYEDIVLGWDVPSNDDPNNDGIRWLGPSTFTADDVNNWDDRCQTYELSDPTCECPLKQILCIDILGDGEIPERTIYMYDCQFNEDKEYEWTWPNTFDDFNIRPNDELVEVEIRKGSYLMDFENDNCDTTMFLTVETYNIPASLEQIECANDTSSYRFNFDLSFLDNNTFDNWPRIEDDYTIDWINCDDGTILNTNSENFSIGEEQQVCVKVTYSFNNGVWGDPSTAPFTEIVGCDKIYGPYQLTLGCDQKGICPQLNQMTISINGETSSNPGNLNLNEGESLTLNLQDNLLPNGGTIDWYISDQENFIPGQQGTKVGSAAISSNWSYGLQAPELLAISYRDPFDRSEYFVVGSGSGLYVDDMTIDSDNNCDASCPSDCITELYGSQCPWKLSDKTVLQDCANIIPVGPGDYVPPNSTLVVFIDEDAENLIRSAQSLCSSDGCIYVLFNECNRCLDAFADQGSASYTLNTSVGSSTLSYVANQDGGSVNSNGTFAFERDSLPQINQTKFDITSEITPFNTTISCSEFSGQQYLRGVVVDSEFASDCCNPYTSTLSLNINCPDPTTTLEWVNQNALPKDLIINNGTCSSAYVFPGNSFSDGSSSYAYPLLENIDYRSTCNGPISFTSTHTPQSGFPEGDTQVTYTISDACGNVLSHRFTITIVCDMPPPPPSGDDNVLDEFTWLNSLVDTTDCAGTTINVYESGIFNYIHVQTTNSGILYFQTGDLYCTDSNNFSCVTAYGFGAPVSTWECDGVVTPPPGPDSIPEIYTDYPFLENLIDLSDCLGTTVSVYETGVFNFIHIQTTDSGTLYFQDGTLYCTDSANFSCVSAYGFGSPVSVWNCNNSGGGPTPTTPQIFEDYIWLGDQVDISDCDDLEVSVCQTGSFRCIFIDDGSGLMDMYTVSGQLYCQDGPGFSCFDAYGFEESDFIESWACGQAFTNQEVEQRVKQDEQRVELIDINVYPNPTTGVVWIDGLGKENEIKMYDLNGQQVKSFHNLNDKSKLDLNSLASGVYILRIKEGSEMKLHKIIKL